MQRNGRLSRREVAARLKCSYELVRIFELKGQLTPVLLEMPRGGCQMKTYEPSEVEVIAATFVPTKRSLHKRTLHEGPRLRRVFRAMKRGITGVSELIAATGCTPATIAKAAELQFMTVDDLGRKMREEKEAKEAKAREKERKAELTRYEIERAKRMGEEPRIGKKAGAL